MNRILFTGLYKKCAVNVDDIIVFGKTKEEHNANLEWVLAQCELNNVKIKFEKCVSFQREVKYLGLAVSESCIKPLADKMESLKASNAPRNKTEMRSMIGRLNFYARFRNNYSSKLKPFRALLQKTKDFQWTEQHQKAFELVLSDLQGYTSLVFAPKDERKIIELHMTDTSIEALLLREKGQLMSRASKLLGQAESNYSSVEKEMLALVLALDKFEPFLDPSHFTITVPTNALERCPKLVHKPERIESQLLRIPERFYKLHFETTNLQFAKISQSI